MAAFRSILSLLGLGGNGSKGAEPEAAKLAYELLLSAESRRRDATIGEYREESLPP
jgi:hypothetical protein